jgi:hypothetical protein
MKVNLKTRNKIAQLIVDMSIGEQLPIRKPDMVPVIKEVNDTPIIGHAVRFVRNANGDPVAIKKYRKTAIEQRVGN